MGGGGGWREREREREIERERVNDRFLYVIFINKGNGINTILFFYIQPERERERETERERPRHTDRQIDRDRQTDRQTDRERVQINFDLHARPIRVAVSLASLVLVFGGADMEICRTSRYPLARTLACFA